jgi:CheY-like chemotaxis protein
MSESSKKLVLVIEDDESVRKLLERALSATYAVESVADGNAALRRLEAVPTPDVVVCDIMMPGLDGLSVARKAKSSPVARQVPFIFLTAKTAPTDVIQGIQAGARFYVTKPFKLDDLLQKVRKVIG